MNRRLGIAIALVALALVPSQAAAASWSEPETIAREPFVIETLALGVDARGGAQATWDNAAWAGRTGSRWRVEPRSGLVGPEMLVDDRGRALHVGFKVDRARNAVPAVAASAGGRAGPVVPLDVHRPRRTVSQVVAAGNRRGDAIVAWSTFREYTGEYACGHCEDVFVRVRRRGGPFGPRQAVSRRMTINDLRVAMNDAGEAAVVWTKTFEYSEGEVFARVLGRDGAWSRRDRIPSRGWTVSPEGATDIQVALGPRGRLLVAWAATVFGEGADSNEYALPVEYAVRRGRGGFTRPIRLSDNSAIGGRECCEAGSVAHLDAAYIGADTALVAWTASDGEERAHVHGALVRGAKVVQRQQLTSGALEAEVADVAAGPGGTGLLLLYTRGGEIFYWEPRELRSVLVRNGAFATPKIVRRGDNEIDLASAGIDPRSGRATAVWVERLRKRRSSVRTATLRTR